MTRFSRYAWVSAAFAGAVVAGWQMAGYERSAGPTYGPDMAYLLTAGRERAGGASPEEPDDPDVTPVYPGRVGSGDWLDDAGFAATTNGPSLWPVATSGRWMLPGFWTHGATYRAEVPNPSNYSPTRWDLDIVAMPGMITNVPAPHTLLGSGDATHVLASEILGIASNIYPLLREEYSNNQGITRTGTWYRLSGSNLRTNGTTTYTQTERDQALAAAYGAATIEEIEEFAPLAPAVATVEANTWVTGTNLHASYSTEAFVGARWFCSPVSQPLAVGTNEWDWGTTNVCMLFCLGFEQATGLDGADATVEHLEDLYAAVFGDLGSPSYSSFLGGDPWEWYAELYPVAISMEPDVVAGGDWYDQQWSVSVADFGVAIPPLSLAVFGAEATEYFAWLQAVPMGIVTEHAFETYMGPPNLDGVGWVPEYEEAP